MLQEVAEPDKPMRKPGRSKEQYSVILSDSHL